MGCKPLLVIVAFVLRFLSFYRNFGLHSFQLASMKKKVREIEREGSVLVFDEKPYTDENEHQCWHFDHTKNQSVKDINLLNSSPLLILNALLKSVTAQPPSLIDLSHASSQNSFSEYNCTGRNS
jgi:hypothetical protein